jgi:hypothetical protein
MLKVGDVITLGLDTSSGRSDIRRGFSVAQTAVTVSLSPVRLKSLNVAPGQRLLRSGTLDTG